MIKLKYLKYFWNIILIGTFLKLNIFFFQRIWDSLMRLNLTIFIFLDWVFMDIFGIYFVMIFFKYVWHFLFISARQNIGSNRNF